MSGSRSTSLAAGAAVLLAVAAIAGGAGASCVPPPAGVARIEGVVREAAGGDTVCIETAADPLHLVRLRLLDVTAPQLRGPGGEGAKWALRRTARGRAVVCEVAAGAGVCRIDGVAVGEILRAKRRGAQKP